MAVPYADLANPQTLNLYAYVENNPLTGMDPDGHFRQAVAEDAGNQYRDPDLPPKPAEMSTWQFLKEEVKGVWDVTGGAVVALTQSVASGEAAANIAETARLAVSNPAAIGEALKEGGRQLAETGRNAASGDPRAIGQVVGMVATALAPAAKSVTPQTTVYRVYGGEAAAMGRYWTATNPARMSNVRGQLGLPAGNSGRFVIEGRVSTLRTLRRGRAAPGPSGPGGAREIRLPNAQRTVRVQRVSGVNPEF